jgi:hypothetical protein
LKSYGEVKETKELGSNFIESGEDSMVVFEESKGTLEIVAFFVEMPVVITLLYR